jgi:hypothetical protein
MLTELMKHHPDFQVLPLDLQEIFLSLAKAFQENIDNTYDLAPTELQNDLNIGNRDLWQDFLQLEPVEQYIKNQSRLLTKVAHRKSIRYLQKEMQKGSIQASRELKELSGIMERQDDNTVIVLHHVPRPRPEEAPVQ